MRVKIGIAGVLGLGVSVTVALAQGPRGATLLPPQAADPAEVPVVARAAAESLPPFPNSTPITRSAAKAAAGPAWLNGTDANVRPAAGTSTNKDGVRVLTPPGTPKDEPSFVARGLDKLKTAFGGDHAERPNLPPPASQPAGTPAAKQPATADTPFRGTAANGQPVYAGPPAWRWNGYGAPTPGGNPYAPTGHYPRASANWYTITGATPGAFPVPVMNPLRPHPGTEPPAYVATPTPRTPPGPVYAPRPVVTRPPLPTAPVAPPAPLAPSPVAPVGNTTTEQPRLPPPAMTGTESVVPAPPVAVPTLTPPPAPVVPVTPPAPPITRVTETDPAVPRMVAGPLTIAPLLPARTDTVAPLPALPVLPPVRPPGAEAPAAGPGALPVSVTEEQPMWQSNPARPARSDWNPVGGALRPQPEANWQQSDTARTKPVARGQVGDNQPDPVATLIRRVCEGRADGIDVRWTGTKKLTVCFECRTAPDAQKLVKDVSGRPELAPYQIDFCVVVK